MAATLRLASTQHKDEGLTSITPGDRGIIWETNILKYCAQILSVNSYATNKVEKNFAFCDPMTVFN